VQFFNPHHRQTSFSKDENAKYETYASLGEDRELKSDMIAIAIIRTRFGSKCVSRSADDEYKRRCDLYD
jgi:hypothetical protein